MQTVAQDDEFALLWLATQSKWETKLDAYLRRECSDLSTHTNLSRRPWHRDWTLAIFSRRRCGECFGVALRRAYRHTCGRTCAFHSGRSWAPINLTRDSDRLGPRCRDFNRCDTHRRV